MIKKLLLSKNIPELQIQYTHIALGPHFYVHFLSFTVFLKPSKIKTYQKKKYLLVTLSSCVLNVSRRWHPASSSYRPRLVLLIFHCPPSWAVYRSHPHSSSCVTEALKPDEATSTRHFTTRCTTKSASEDFSKCIEQAWSIGRPRQRLSGAHVKAARLCEPWLKPKVGFSYILTLFL